MNNPWENIDLEIYEEHMQSDNVFQLQTLNLITKEQLNSCNHKTVGILGVAGGNGLEHIELANINKVYGFDINKNYLDICQKRFSYMQGKLVLIQKDFTQKDFILPATDLLIANMIIEYIGILRFTEFVNRNKTKISLISCTVQNEENDEFVSESKYTSAFDSLETILHTITPNKLIESLAQVGFKCIEIKEYKLPNDKEFIRLDFQKSRM